MHIKAGDADVVGTYRYIGDTLSDVISHLARRTADEDMDTAVASLTAQLAAFGASRVAEDAAWCRYAIDASRRGEPLTVVL
jgi:phage tail sheath protein FI